MTKLGAGRKDLVAGLEADFQGLDVSSNQYVSNTDKSSPHAGDYLVTKGASAGASTISARCAVARVC